MGALYPYDVVLKEAPTFEDEWYIKYAELALDDYISRCICLAVVIERQQKK